MFSYVIEPNLELRPLEERSAEEMYQVSIANRDHLRPFMPWVEKVKSVEDTRKFIRDSLEGFANRTCFNVGIWEHGKYIGGAGFHHIDWIRQCGEIGYWLAADAQGRGIMTKVCRALINHGFDAMKFHRIEIRCDPDNARSRAIPQRLGFQQEGVLRESLERYDGVMRDAVVYGLLTHEWSR
jgi:ribosomal-protein-serine acetyltransferase